ncbi:hypothetical protein BsWGS_15007 [Bradybaena similaris]
MTPSSRSPSCYRGASAAPNKTAPCIPFMMETFPASCNSGLTGNGQSCQASRSSGNTNGNAAVSRRPPRSVEKHGRRSQCKYQRSPVRGRKTELKKKKRKSSAHRVVSKPRREIVRQKLRKSLLAARLRALKAVKGCLDGSKTLLNKVAITKTKRNTSSSQRGKTSSPIKKRSQAVKPKLYSRTGRSPKRAESRRSCKNKGKGRRCDSSSDESAHSSVSRYVLVHKSPPRVKANPNPSCSGASKRRRSERSSSKDSSRKKREHRQHKNRSWNRSQDRNDSSSASSDSRCCKYSDRSPLQSPIRSLTPRRQDSTLKFASRSKDRNGHHSKNRSDNKCRRSCRDSSSDSETDSRRRNEKIRGGGRRSKKCRECDSAFCVIM